jgi:ubiquinol-cytochrome c reductase cytochrome b subunit
MITRRWCISLQRKDQHLLEHGVETGIIRQLPSGEFTEITRPVSEEARAVLESRSLAPGLPAPDSVDENGIPAPQSRGALGKVRTRLNTVLTESIELAPGDGHGDGHGNGHGQGNAMATTRTAIPPPRGRAAQLS